MPPIEAMTTVITSDAHLCSLCRIRRAIQWGFCVPCTVEAMYAWRDYESIIREMREANRGA
jgi:hypothetical protein